MKFGLCCMTTLRSDGVETRFCVHRLLLCFLRNQGKYRGLNSSKKLFQTAMLRGFSAFLRHNMVIRFERDRNTASGRKRHHTRSDPAVSPKRGMSNLTTSFWGMVPMHGGYKETCPIHAF